MPNTILLHDALRSLERGHLLRKAGGMSSGLYLECVPEIALVFDRLLRDGYLLEIEFPGRSREAIRFFTLSELGREKSRQISRWFGGLHWYLKLWGRLGLPLPDSVTRG